VSGQGRSWIIGLFRLHTCRTVPACDEMGVVLCSYGSVKVTGNSAIP